MLKRVSCLIIHKPRHVPFGESVHTKWPETPSSTVVINRAFHLNLKLENSSAICNAQTSLKRVRVFLNPWFWLNKFGFKTCKQVRFRRKLRKFYYPWLIFSIPTGFAMVVGDMVAQIYIEKADKDKFNIMRTLHFAAIGTFIAAPIASKWTLFWMRRISRTSKAAFIAKSILLDMLILTPALALITMAGYDYKMLMKKYEDPVNLFKTRYKETLKDIMTFYIQTRPLLALISCYILPKNIGKFIRTLYFIAFYSYMSHAFQGPPLGHYKPVKAGKTKGKQQEGWFDWFKRLFTDLGKLNTRKKK